MSRPLQQLGLLSATLLSLGSASPSLAALALHPGDLQPGPAVLVARGGGGGRGGGGRMGGGGIDRSRAPSGFGQAGPSFNRGNTRPSGGWSNRANIGNGGGPSLSGSNRFDGNRGQGGNWGQGSNRPSGNWSNGNRFNGNRFNGNSVNVNRNWNRVTNVNVNAGWARPGWGGARPWNWGWYGGWSSPPWGWWAARTAAWGITGLATASIINNAVNSAIAASSPVIVVPDTGYQLLYGTVQPVGSSSVSFVVQANGSEYQLTADCQQGLINGQQPQSADQAQLLNAACQVAFGSA